MENRFIVMALSVAVLLGAAQAGAQEASIHHGFLFFAGESYSVDEKTYGVYEDGNKFEDLIKDNAEALSQFHGYEAWHTTAIVSTSLSLAAIAFGGVFYMFEKDMSEALGDSAGILGFASGGGLLLFGMIFEFIAWGKISSAAETYNGGLMDEGHALHLEGAVLPTVAVAPDGGAHLALTWRF